MCLLESRKASQSSGHGGVGWSLLLQGREGVVGLVKGRGTLQSTWSLQGQGNLAAFGDFHIVLIMIVCVFNIHLCCLLIQALALTAAHNGVG